MIVYGPSLSPFVRKVLIALAEKGLTADTQPTFPNSNDAEFRACSPFGKVPGFRDGDFTLCDSTAIITYLDAAFPDKPLLPADPKDRARTIWYEEFADTILTPAVGKMFFNRIVAPRFMGATGDMEAADKAEREEVPPVLAYIEKVLPASGFLVGDALTLADVAVASPLVNFTHAGGTIDAETYPKTAAFYAAMTARPSLAPIVAGEKAMLGG